MAGPALIGAVAATLVGTLANDSGALLLEIGHCVPARLHRIAWARATAPVLPPLAAGPVHPLGYSLRANRSRLAIFLELPGGVNRHVEALREFLGRGHHVRVLAPSILRSAQRVLHRGPRRRERSPTTCAAAARGIRRQAAGLNRRSFPSRRRRRSPPRASQGRTTWSTSTSPSCAGRLERGAWRAARPS